MRVLLSSTWGAGHIFPMVPLARAFLARGHDVRWAVSNESKDYVSAAGIKTVPSGLSRAAVDELVGSIREGMTGIRPEDKAAAFFPRGFAAGATPAMLADLLPVAQEWQPHLLVHDHAELAAPLVGAVLGVLSVTHAYGGAIPVAILDEATERLAPLWAAYGLTIPPQAGCFTTAYLDICPPKVQTVPTDHIPTQYQLRPVVYSGEPSGVLPEVLAVHDDPLVYVTLGTNHRQSAHEVAVLHSVIDSLEGIHVRAGSPRIGNARNRLCHLRDSARVDTCNPADSPAQTGRSFGSGWRARCATPSAIPSPSPRTCSGGGSS